MIGGKAGRHLGTFGNGAVAGDQDIDVPGSLTQPVDCRLVGESTGFVGVSARVR
jgi:hypothetical protein